MSSTELIELDIAKPVPPQAPMRVRFSSRTIMSARIAAGVLALPFVIMVVTRTGGVGGFIALVIALTGIALLVHVQRRVAARPDEIVVDSEGLSVVRNGRPQRVRWLEIASIEVRSIHRSIRVGTSLDPDALTFDSDIEDRAELLDRIAMHIDVSRREGVPKHARTHAEFRRPAHEDIAMLCTSVFGLVAGLLVRPWLFVVTVLALPRLLWHWLTAPTKLVIDGAAVWIVRPVTRDVIPMRAIRDIAFETAGRPAGLAIMIDHRDRGPIVIGGFNGAAVSLYDALAGARARAREAARAGAAPRRTGETVSRDGAARTGMLQTAAALLGLVAVAWVTILTGVPLRTATRYGNEIAARTALLLGAPVDDADDNGLTALHYAATNNEVGIARAIIEHGANVDARTTPNNLTPLHTAAGRGNAAVAELLIAAGADVDARTTPGRTPLIQASLAFTVDDTAVPALLIAAGADPDIADDAGRTALHHAAGNGHVNQVRQLAGAGANLELADTLGHHPLHLAFMRTHQLAIVALLDAGADPNAPGWAGRNVLTYAASDTAANAQLINLLIDAGSRADLPGADSWNAVQRAARHNNLEMLEVLARRRVRLDATSGTVPTALWIAADNGHTDAARILLRGGANPRIRWQGRTAIELAQSKRNATLVALMQMR